MLHETENVSRLIGSLQEIQTHILTSQIVGVF